MTLSLLTINKTSRRLVKTVADNIRAHDRDEIKTLYSDVDVSEMLTESCEASIELWRINDEDRKVVALGGVAPFAQLPGYCVWLIGTTELDKLQRQREMLRLGKDLMPRLLQRYHRLSNFCSNDKGQLWAMRQLGFTVHETDNEKVRFIECAL